VCVCVLSDRGVGKGLHDDGERTQSGCVRKGVAHVCETAMQCYMTCGEQQLYVTGKFPLPACKFRFQPSPTPVRAKRRAITL
jgi:hypothetical protein